MNTLDCVVSRQALSTALARLSGVVPTRTVIPVYQCLRISGGDGGLRLEATDGDRHAEVSVGLADGDDDFEPVCASLATLLAFVKSCGGVEMALTVKERGLLVSTGSSKATLPMIPDSEWPTMRLDGTDFVDVAAGPALALKTALSLVEYAISTEITKPAFLGVNFGRRGSGIFTTATDAHVIARERVDAWEGEMEPVTIPSAAVYGLLRFLPDDGEMRVLASQTRLRFVHEAGTFTTGTLSDPFPEIVERALQEGGHANVVKVDRAALLAGVRRVAMVLREELLPRTVWTLADGALLSLRAETELGTAEEEVAADVECAADLLIGFSATRVAETLNSLSADTVRIAMKGPRNGTFWSNDGENAGSVRVLWPLNLNP